VRPRASVPKRNTGIAPRLTAASSVIAIDWSTRASASIASPSATPSPPCPPTSSGKGSEQPHLPHLGDDVQRQGLGAVGFVGLRRPLVGEGADHGGQLPLFVAQSVVVGVEDRHAISFDVAVA
jgi:hypothetical protein